MLALYYALIITTAYSEYEHSLTFRVRRYVVIATKPVHRLQIRPISAQLEGTPYHSPRAFEVSYKNALYKSTVIITSGSVQ